MHGGLNYTYSSQLPKMSPPFPFSLGNAGDGCTPHPQQESRLSPMRAEIASFSPVRPVPRMMLGVYHSQDVFLSYVEMDIMLIKCILVKQGHMYVSMRVYNVCKHDDQILLVWLQRMQSRGS